jgi:hypothetical protein
MNWAFAISMDTVLTQLRTRATAEDSTRQRTRECARSACLYGAPARRRADGFRVLSQAAIEAATEEQLTARMRLSCSVPHGPAMLDILRCR